MTLEFRQAVHEIDYFLLRGYECHILGYFERSTVYLSKELAVAPCSQTVILDVIVALAKVMAPILSFTSEEIWRTFPDSIRTHPDTPACT